MLGQLFTGHFLDELVIATNYQNCFESWNPGMIILFNDLISWREKIVLGGLASGGWSEGFDTK
ncbi:hypothetical protein E4U22_006881 [Claviceps purpurea]|nr:hypothetical protein E4U26_005338 [Claviceps purpurea]KAG6244440.1 hypothetical protein E4U23_006197 [Claviceps purpurea]KAG6309676.1 hypothetical protein E4U44_006558 [Claviceps purpurea]KAG6316720.1 hypothetical protein E4U22_006881 [Claviceps purpurea]